MININNIPQPIPTVFIEIFDPGLVMFAVCWGCGAACWIGACWSGDHGICCGVGTGGGIAPICGIGIFAEGIWSTIFLYTNEVK